MSSTFSVYSGQKQALNPLEMELLLVLGYPKWVLTTKVGYSAKAESIFSEPSLKHNHL